MTQTQAIAAARRMALQYRAWTFVVYEPGEGYQPATDLECETFYQGASVVAAVSPSGTVE